MACVCGRFVALAFCVAGAAALRENQHDRTSSALARRLQTSLEAQESAKVQHKPSVFKAINVEQNLIVCNAYAYKKPLDVYTTPKRLLTTSGPIPYKECRDFTLVIQDGEEIDFKAGNFSVGTFFTKKLPRTSSSLLLVPHRRNPNTTSATFESHAFKPMAGSTIGQIAIVDGFRGHEQRGVRITDGAANEAPHKRSEELLYNSVIAIKPGRYGVTLMGSDDDKKGEQAVPLEVIEQSKNVVMRVGNDGHEAYKQELVVFSMRPPLPLDKATVMAKLPHALNSRGGSEESAPSAAAPRSGLVAGAALLASCAATARAL